MDNRKGTILVVDDANDICTCLKDVFTELGYKVDIATNIHDSLKLLNDTNYDLLLVDLIIDKTDGGISIINHAKYSRIKSLIFVMTAYQEEHKIKEALACGALRLFRKPFDIDEVVETFEQELKKRNS